MTLKIVLKPGERFVVNGALFQNLERKSTLALHNHAWVVRDKEFLNSQEAVTPAGRCYSRMLAVIMNPTDIGAVQEEISSILMNFSLGLSDDSARLVCHEVHRLWGEGRYYNALKTLRPLCTPAP